MLTSHRNQSPNLQRKLIDWFQHEKNIDMKKANNNEISKTYLPVRLKVSIANSA